MKKVMIMLRAFLHLPRRSFAWVPRILAGLFLILIAFTTSAQTSRTVKVLRVIDGDTFVLTTGEKIRLLGVDTPEMDSKDSKEKLLAQQAALITKNFTEGKYVRLTFDGSTKDIFGRFLAYVFLTDKKGKDSIFVQTELLKAGLARILMYDKKKMYYDLFYNLRNTARRNKLGIWSK
jgi:micrococcal nuclease